MTIARSRSLRVRIRRRAVGRTIDQAFAGLSKSALWVPLTWPRFHGVERLRNLSYGPDRAHTLDVWRPSVREEALPVVLYVHGGAFRSLSKDTHWLMGLAYARRNMVVFNVNYRLATRYKYPAAPADVCRAYAWVVANAARFGGDVRRLVLAGESAGGNLVTTLAIAAAYDRPETWTRPVRASGVLPVACLPMCGMLQVSDPERFNRPTPLSSLEADALYSCSGDYLPDHIRLGDPAADLANPLCVLERGEVPPRPLPAFYAAAGTRDPLLADSERLGVALRHLGVHTVIERYPGEMHAFHALVWRPAARACWRAQENFLDEVFSRVPGA
jgi:acetyl esterase